MSLADRRHAHFMAWMESEGLNAHALAKRVGMGQSTLVDYIKRNTSSLKGDTEAKIAQEFGLPVEAIFGGGDGAEAQNYVGPWRRSRGVDLDDLAKRLGVPVQTLEDLEAGRLSFSPTWRRRVSDALDIREGYLLLDPEDVPPEVLELFSKDTPPAKRKQAQDMLRILRTGTEG